MWRMSAPAGEVMEEADAVSLCSLHAGGEIFGIDTKRIREVLGVRAAQRVPLAPGYIGGVVPYRGEVLTAVSFRALLGMAPYEATSCILVLEEEEAGAHFGLMVDSVGGVVTVSKGALEANPTTLDERGKAIFDGAYKTAKGLIVQLDTRKLRPGWIEASGMCRESGQGGGR